MTRFRFEVLKVKELEQILKVLHARLSRGPAAKVCPVFFLPGANGQPPHAYISVKPNNAALIHIAMYPNLLHDLQVESPVLIGMDVAKWIQEIHAMRRQHVRVIRVHNDPDTGLIHFDSVGTTEGGSSPRVGPDRVGSNRVGSEDIDNGSSPSGALKEASTALKYLAHSPTIAQKPRLCQYP